MLNPPMWLSNNFIRKTGRLQHRWQLPVDIVFQGRRFGDVEEPGEPVEEARYSTCAEINEQKPAIGLEHSFDFSESCPFRLNRKMVGYQRAHDYVKAAI